MTTLAIIFFIVAVITVGISTYKIYERMNEMDEARNKLIEYVGRLSNAATDIQTLIQNLREDIAAGITVEEITQQLEPIATKLEAIVTPPPPLG